jgi:hypothetical protein
MERHTDAIYSVELIACMFLSIAARKQMQLLLAKLLRRSEVPKDMSLTSAARSY